MKYFDFLLNKKNISRGFTLIEMLVYLGLFSILILLITEIFFSALDVQLESRSTSDVEQDGRFILARLMYDIENTQSITTPASAGQQNSTLQITVNGIGYTYAVNSGDLQLTNDKGVNILNSYDITVSNLTFTRLGVLGKPTITVNLTLTSKTKRTAGAESKSYQTTMGLR